METLEVKQKKKIDRHNLVIWIIGVTLLWYIFIFEVLAEIVFDLKLSPVYKLFVNIDYMPDAMFFAYSMYLITLISFLGIIVYTMVTKRNRFVFRSFLPKYGNNKVSVLLLGFLVGFIMNFGCIVCALIFRYVRKTFNEIENGDTPFTEVLTNRVKVIGIIVTAFVLFGYGIFEAFMAAAIMLTMYMVFRYGFLLQTESDETV